ncbi:MAG TPA: flagellar biosynthesis protein FlhF [Lachnospiraceae bacterium]|nr:flagellar biosynthesis protein FlhF [Lachnospiraceae bacterium]
MIIKKFQGKTEEEAMEAAKKELGDSIIVMNVKSVKRKGIFAAFKRPMIEVTVALEEETERFTPVKKETTQTTNGALKKDTPITSAWVKDGVANHAVQAPQKKSTVEMGTIEEKLDSLQTLLVKQLKTPEAEKTLEKTDEQTVKEPVEEKDAELVKFMKLLYNIMLENEIDEKYVNQIMEEIEKVHKPNTPFDYALANTYQRMILKFGKSVEISPSEKGPKVVFFVGPTGVGKTTTIAKIASRFSVDDKKKVALLTADTYRIAAAEQLRTYANILEVPFRVIYTIEELENALRDFKDFEYIFVDTAGHSHQNQAQKEAMRSLIHCVDGLADKEVFLVLSATTKYRDLLSIADSYKEMADYKLIFTKLDETTAFGNLFNLRLYTNASLSYVTCGQNVPDDIEKFSPQKTVKQLLGGRM